ncbi:MAG: hypothetical protein WA160_03330 [Pseudobdellovibrio sp.]
MKLTVIFICLFGLLQTTEARIRLRKVKDAPRTCVVMKEDDLLSRDDKLVWATERNSIVIDDELTLVNDLGQKICQWNKSAFTAFGDVASFRFYIDEYKDIIYPYIDKKELGVLIFKVPFRTCALDDQKTLITLELPKCDKPKTVSKKAKKKKK